MSGFLDGWRSPRSTTTTAILWWCAVLVIGFAAYQLWMRPGAVFPFVAKAAEDSATPFAARDTTQTPAGTTGVGNAPDPQSPAGRLARLENLVQGYESQFQKLQTSASLAESKQAVQRAQAAGLTVQIKAHRERIQKLKTMDAAWQVKAPALLTGEAGRRIVASPPHWEIAQSIWERDRPTTEQLLQWEVQLEALATPVESRSQDPDSAWALTPEHVQALDDLGSQITRSLAEFEQRQLLLDELVRETAGIDPGSQTLQAALDKRRVAEVKARTERMVAAQQAARAEAEKQQADLLAKLERDLVEAETRLKEAERKATIAGLRDQTAKVEAALQEVAEEREFERALPQIRVSLGSFLAPGFALRREKTKGPASFSLIETQGALAPTREGLVKLVYLASVNNDRPLVGLPSWVDNDVSGETGWQRTPKEPMERAQALLTKWGPMLVKKGMLSP